MDLGLYQLKYAARKIMAGILPAFQHVSPNLLSLALLPIGLATAWVYHRSAADSRFLAAGACLIVARMFFGTLDGLVAEHFGKQSPSGNLLNRATPEICDVMLLMLLPFARPDLFAWAIAALALAWLTSFFGILGVIEGKPIQSVGPVGQTDRLAALLFLSLIGLWTNVDVIRIFLIWTFAGGIFTVCLRIWRTFK